MSDIFNRSKTLFIALVLLTSATGAGAMRKEAMDQSPLALFSYSHSYAKAGFKKVQNDKASKPDYLGAATEAAKWIRSTTMETPKGRIWPDDALNKEAISTGIADGVAGKTLFFLQMHRATRKGEYLKDARIGADYLLATIPSELDLSVFPPATSLYYGAAGTGFTLHQMHKATGDKKYLDGALRVIELLHKHAKDQGSGIEWTHYNDVLFGNSGTALFLLYAGREMNHAASKKLAIKTGRRLLEKALKEHGGLNWKFRDDRDIVLPNFSHGAAGIGYFLAALYMETSEKEFLEAALGSARYLKAIAKTEGDVFLVPYGWPNENWKGYYDTGWAHGPAGTARLFYRLWQITKDPAWMEPIKGCALGLRQSGMPGKPGEGFGEEEFKLDRRFGVASVADFFLDLYRATGEKSHLDFALQLNEAIMKKATRDSQGVRWIFPRYSFMQGAGTEAAFTGYFYGSAGYGLLQLRFDSTGKDETWRINLPDDPFPAGGRSNK